ncbi:MAG TPA: transposase [Caulobacteraceae bacterium]|jgi:putative transposase
MLSDRNASRRPHRRARIPHHVTQRGNNRAPIFFKEGDHHVYRHMLRQQADLNGVEVWAYCLMPNHVHLVMTPSTEDGLARAVGETHRRYTSFVNARANRTGHLFQSRYASVAMDEKHLWAAIRYVSLNPVRAGLVERADDWPWSSVRAHLKRMDDALVSVRPVLERVGDFASYLVETDARYEEAVRALRVSALSGRPLGSRAFLEDVELRLRGAAAA